MKRQGEMKGKNHYQSLYNSQTDYRLWTFESWPHWYNSEPPESWSGSPNVKQVLHILAIFTVSQEW